MSDALKALFAEVLEVEVGKLTEESSPQSLKEWDSLAAMKLVSAIGEKFRIQLSTKEIMKMSTIGLARRTLQTKNVTV